MRQRGKNHSGPISTRLPKMQLVLSNWQETILNTVGDSTLVVHFKSIGNDLDEHVINARGNYNGNFKENILQTTLFW